MVRKEPGMAPYSTHPASYVDADLSMVGCIPKRDRRGPHRIEAYECPRCLLSDAVTGIARQTHALRLLCQRCAWSWVVAVRCEGCSVTADSGDAVAS